jgi:AcrR family transcriptional regulator
VAVQQQSTASVGDAPPRRSQADRRAEAERALLDAAMRLFAERGVEGTSLADIGEAAGYSRGLANHHFGSRAGLVERLARRGVRRFVRALEAGERPTPGPDAVLAFAEAYLALFDPPGDDVRAFFVMRGTALPHDAPLREVFAADDRRVRHDLVRLVEAGRRAGTVADDVDAEAFATMLIGMLRGVGTQCLLDPDAVDLDRIRRRTRAFVHAALAP